MGDLAGDILGSRARIWFLSIIVLLTWVVIAVFAWMVAITVGEDGDQQMWLFENLLPFQIGLAGVTNSLSLVSFALGCVLAPFQGELQRSNVPFRGLVTLGFT